MDFLENKSNNILRKLREIQRHQSCTHVGAQIGLWVHTQIHGAPPPPALAQPQPNAPTTLAAVKSEPNTTTPQANNNHHQLLNHQSHNHNSNLNHHHQQQQQQQHHHHPHQHSRLSGVAVAAADDKIAGCFLSNIKHLENFDSDATESTSSDDTYDELEDFGHQDIPPRKSRLPPHLQHHQIVTNAATTTTATLPINHTTHTTASHPNVADNSNKYNTHQHHHTSSAKTTDLQTKAIWRWANERSRLAARWTWLQAQVADLEFRIRGQNDATMHARAYKTAPLPPVLPENSCSRTVPLSKDFRRRRLIKSSQILSNSTKKLVKFSHVPCVCSSLPQTVAPCLSCNGRYNYMRQSDGENAPISERISLLDPCCHPVLSFPDDLTLGSQISYLLKQETINRKPTKGRPGRKKGSTAANLAAQAAAAALANGDTNYGPGKKGKYYRGMVGRPPGSQSGAHKNPSQTILAYNKLRRKYRKHSNGNNFDSQWGVGNNYHGTRRGKKIRRTSSMNEGSVCSESSNQYRPNHYSNNNSSAQNVTRRRRSEQSAYDIDNIVIPFSIAATTRVEILEYKEIMTPSWRVWEDGACLQAEGGPAPAPEETEDTSDEAYASRHVKGEVEEKKRFSINLTARTASTSAATAATTTTAATATTAPTTTTTTTTTTATTTSQTATATAKEPPAVDNNSLG